MMQSAPESIWNLTYSAIWSATWVSSASRNLGSAGAGAGARGAIVCVQCVCAQCVCGGRGVCTGWGQEDGCDKAA